MDTNGSGGLTSLLFGKTRRAVLGLLFTRPDESFHLRELARLSGAALGPVQREVAALAGAGLLVREPRGRQVFYRLDPRCPVYSELKALVVKTAGLGDVLRRALAPLARKVPVAFVFGSFARGEQAHASDVDLLVVGGASFAELAQALREPQARLARVVNPTVYSALETAALLFGGNASDYAISTLGNDPNQINFMAHVDGWGDDQYLFSTVAQDYKLDTGAPGYNDPYGGPSYSAYVLDHSCYNRYTSPNQGCTDTAIGQNFAFRINGAVPEPGTWAMLVLGFGMMGASLRRRRAESSLRPA